MAVGYNSTFTGGEITSLDQLQDPRYHGQVVLPGDPGSGTNDRSVTAVIMAALAHGGSVNNLAPGVAYFKTLHQAGTLSTANTTLDAAARDVNIIFDWTSSQAYEASTTKTAGVTWKTFVPTRASIGTYITLAINKNATHPAAARLWDEFLFSTEGQNLLMKGGRLPILYPKMKQDGTIDPAAEAALPTNHETVRRISDQESIAAVNYLKANWSRTME